MQSLCLFRGIGGALLADLLNGHAPICAVEWNKYRCSVLRERQVQGWFPNLEVCEQDIRTFDGSRWAGKVDCLHAAIPCPKWSSARRGVGDSIDYTDEVVRIIREVQPKWVFIECVAQYKREHLRLAEALAKCGVTLSRPLIVGASAVGAPHPRKRYWALGHADLCGQPVRPIHAEAPKLPSLDKSMPWDADPNFLRMDDGNASRMVRMRALGDAQVTLQAAVAWRLLGGPVND